MVTPKKDPLLPLLPRATVKSASRPAEVSSVTSSVVHSLLKTLACVENAYTHTNAAHSIRTCTNIYGTTQRTSTPRQAPCFQPSYDGEKEVEQRKLRRLSPPARMKASFSWENIRRTNHHHNRRGNSQPRRALTSNAATINIVMLPPRAPKIRNKTAVWSAYEVLTPCNFKQTQHRLSVCEAAR